jgi:ABC-2 type transport system permease protein
VIKLLNLLLNENMKIYRRLRTWILVAVVIVITTTMLIIIHNTNKVPQANGDWKTTIQHQIDNNKILFEQTKLPSDKVELKAKLNVDQYRLEHNKPPTDRSLWGGVLNAVSLISLVTIFTVVIAADSVAGEFSGGTIKMLLIRPVSRSKILLSKYIATFAFSVLLLVVLFGSSFLISGMLEGFRDVGAPYIYAASDGIVHEVNMVGHLLSTYGYQCIELIMIVSVAFMISTVFRSSSIAIAFSIGMLFLGYAIGAFLTNYSWTKYYLFSNIDLTQYLNGSPRIAGMTLQFSIIVLICYFLIFNVLSWGVFKKRDVGA